MSMVDSMGGVFFECAMRSGYTITANQYGSQDFTKYMSIGVILEFVRFELGGDGLSGGFLKSIVFFEL